MRQITTNAIPSTSDSVVSRILRDALKRIVGCAAQRVKFTSTSHQASKVLEIEFPSGEVYRYFGVPSDVNRGLLTANSAGRYFHEYIRDGYEYVHVE